MRRCERVLLPLPCVRAPVAAPRITRASPLNSRLAHDCPDFWLPRDALTLLPSSSWTGSYTSSHSYPKPTKRAEIHLIPGGNVTSADERGERAAWMTFNVIIKTHLNTFNESKLVIKAV